MLFSLLCQVQTGRVAQQCACGVCSDPCSYFCTSSVAKLTPSTLVAFKMNGEIVVLLPEKHELLVPATLYSERDGLQ